MAVKPWPGLAVSCNPCFIQVGARLGKQNFCDYFAAFGLRAATGIDLPGEIKRSEYYTADRMGRWSWLPAPSGKAAR